MELSIDTESIVFKEILTEFIDSFIPEVEHLKENEIMLLKFTK